MKRKDIAKAVALLLSAVMLAGSLTGCGSNADSGTSSAESASDAGSASEGTDKEDASTQESAAEDDTQEGSDGMVNAEGLPIVNEPVTFTIAVPQTSELKAAAERECVKRTEEETGIHIEWVEIPKSGWSEKINILFSTDSLPDAICGGVDVSKYYEQLLAWDDYMETYAPNVNAFFDTRDDYPNSLIAPDGKIRCMPIGDESYSNSIDSLCWINRDWLKKLNLEMPQTPEELKEVLIAFRDQDPNGNGQKDEIPFTFMNVWGWGNAIEDFFGPWGVVENSGHVFLKDDNTVVFSPEEKGYYECLVYLNDLYNEGLIDKDVFTMSQEQYDAKGSTGDVIGMHINYSGGNCGVDNGDGSSDTDRYVPLPLLKGPDGTQMTCQNNAYPGDNFVITTACENPEALVRWYDYINSSVEEALLWGRGAEDVRWKKLEDGTYQWILMSGEDLTAAGGYTNAGEYRNAESFSGSTPSLWRQSYETVMVNDPATPVPNYRKDALDEMLPKAVFGLPSGMSSDPSNEERRVILRTDIDTYLKKFVADSIINGIDEGKWDAHLKTLGDLKCDEYKQLCQDYVNDYFSR